MADLADVPLHGLLGDVGGVPAHRRRPVRSGKVLLRFGA
jgi:hypothetical protein